jgi:hypothetical protein
VRWEAARSGFPRSARTVGPLRAKSFPHAPKPPLLPFLQDPPPPLRLSDRRRPSPSLQIRRRPCLPPLLPFTSRSATAPALPPTACDAMSRRGKEVPQLSSSGSPSKRSSGGTRTPATAAPLKGCGGQGEDHPQPGGGSERCRGGGPMKGCGGGTE